MKNQLNTLLLVLVLTGCATTSGDPIVVRAEQAASLALDAFDTFTKLEAKNRAALAEWPNIKRAADYIRENGQPLIKTVRARTVAYQLSRNPEDAAKLDQSMGELAEMKSLAEKTTADLKQSLTK